MTLNIATFTYLPHYLPDGVNLANEDEFIQAGVDLVTLGRNVVLALGELLLWKLRAERITDVESRTALLNRYAGLWGVSAASLQKAYVNVTRFPELPRPEDANSTLTYEILSGARDEVDAEIGFITAIALGYGAAQIREAKFLREHMGMDGWELPTLAYDAGQFTVKREGVESPILVRSNQDNDLVQQGLALLLYRARVNK